MKIMGVFFLQLFDPRYGEVSNCDSLLHDYFTHNFFQDILIVRGQSNENTMREIITQIPIVI